MEGIEKQWWCHTCSKQYASTRGYIPCPDCGGEFVEELSQPQATNVTNDTNVNNQNINNNNVTNQTVNPMNISQGGNQGIRVENGNNWTQVSHRMIMPGFPLNTIFQLLNPLLSQQSNMVVTGTPSVMFQQGGFDPFSIMQQMLAGGGEPLVGNMGDYAIGNLEDVINRLFQQYEKKGNPPASAETIKNLKTITTMKEHVDNHKECAVCKVEYTEGEEVILLPCDHLFHSECIKTWLRMHNTCPICRYEFPTDDKDYEKLRQSRRNGSTTNNNNSNSNTNNNNSNSNSTQAPPSNSSGTGAPQ
jgi:E3 ubiquitin-protein ligase RNF115/126